MHAYHAVREKLRHPGRALDLKAKDLIGHLWVSLIIDQSECLVCFLFLHWINSFLYCLKKTALLLTNQNGEIFSCIINYQIFVCLTLPQVEIRPMMYLALTYDHRLIDGREAVTFLRKIKAAVEDPHSLILDL